MPQQTRLVSTTLECTFENLFDYHVQCHIWWQNTFSEYQASQIQLTTSLSTLFIGTPDTSGEYKVSDANYASSLDALFGDTPDTYSEYKVYKANSTISLGDISNAH